MAYREPDPDLDGGRDEALEEVLEELRKPSTFVRPEPESGDRVWLRAFGPRAAIWVVCSLLFAAISILRDCDGS